MAKMKTCPVCKQKVGVDKLERHVKRVHPREKVEIQLNDEERKEARIARSAYRPPTSRRGKRLIPFSLLMLIIVILAWVYWPHASGPKVGAEAWGFTLPEATSTPPGEMWNLGAHVAEGKPILLEFMHPECGGCQNFAPTLDRLSTDYGDQIQMVSIVIYFEGHGWNKPSISTALGFVRDYNTHWTFLVDKDNNEVRDLYNIRYTPTICIVGTDGRFAWTYEGPCDYSTLEGGVKKVLT